MSALSPLNPLLYEAFVRATLLEDLGRAGDITTDAIVGAEDGGATAIVARDAGVLAGIDIALLAFRLLDPAMEIAIHKEDGERLAPRDVIAKLRGSARALLTAERTALNILGKLSGVATATRAFVDAVGDAHARVVETRKTTPGMRALEKYAVRCGGGANHRFGLDDAVLIKDNHVAFAGGVREAVARVKAHAGHLVKIELEVDTLDQLREALDLPIDAVLLDNMSPETMREAVRLVGGRILTEASGNVRLATIAAIAATGVDLISSGAITHSAPNLDIGLDAIP
jgi:nicotinate-nucleotide pyrophosphorylase (carboxylating)